MGAETEMRKAGHSFYNVLEKYLCNTSLAKVHHAL